MLSTNPAPIMQLPELCRTIYANFQFFHPCRKDTKILGIILLALCIIAPRDLPSFSLHEKPLVNPRGIAVDSSGNVYCGILDYDCIQKYDDEGNFLLRIPVNQVGHFLMRINKDEEIEIGIARAKSLLYYSTEGKYLRKSEYDTYYRTVLNNINHWECKAKDGTVFRIKNSFIYPSVVKIMPNGSKSTIISVPINVWLASSNFLRFLLSIIGFCLFLYAKKFTQSVSQSKTVSN